MIDRTIVITNPPDYVDVTLHKKGFGKSYKAYKKRKYFTANIWFGGESGQKNDIKVKAAAKEKVNQFFMVYVNKLIPELKEEDYPIQIMCRVYRPMTNFDLHNKAFFWCKLFEDYLVRKGKIVDDSVKYVRREIYDYVESKESKIVFRIKTLDVQD